MTLQQQAQSAIAEGCGGHLNLNKVEKVWIVATSDMCGNRSEKVIATSADGTEQDALYYATLGADLDWDEPVDATFSHYAYQGEEGLRQTTTTLSSRR